MKILVLSDKGNILNTILIKGDVLAQNTELLARIQKEAVELYGQEVECHDPKVVDASELHGWLKAMNPDDEVMPWEEEANWALSKAIVNLEWKKEEGVVVFTRCVDGPHGPERVEVTSLEELIGGLEEHAQQAWDGKVPVDGGGQVFEMEDYLDVGGVLFDRCEEYLSDMGWNI